MIVNSPLTFSVVVKWMQPWTLHTLHVYWPLSASTRSSSTIDHLAYFTEPMFRWTAVSFLVQVMFGIGLPAAGHRNRTIFPEGFGIRLTS